MRADEPCCRAHLPQTTRTKRALIRHCYAAGDMMISEIAEFVSCDHRTVWAVVRNEGDDDLGEDQRYLDCEVGDIVNVEALGEMKPFVKKEPVEEGASDATATPGSFVSGYESGGDSGVSMWGSDEVCGQWWSGDEEE